MFKSVKDLLSKSPVAFEEADRYIDRKLKLFLNKKKPKSESYPYAIHDPDLLLGEGSGFESFYLVGNNWLDNITAPIALCYGFNDWKLGFVAEYLSEYRVAFIPRKMRGLRLYSNLRKLELKPECIITWGYTESKMLMFYSKSKKLRFYRMEDGFIRSAELGASHCVPYSLVLDKSGGLYYDASTKSDLEDLLLNYSFIDNPELIKRSREVISLINRLGLSKYNQAEDEFKAEVSSIKTKKRVAVLGQVDSDVSILLGNPNNYTSEDLVKLAVCENPDAEVVYRPHPEVYKGYQKSRFKKKRIEKVASLSSPDESINEFLKDVDQVYTITSLTGFEALLRGIKVTVVGVPFYSGWGVSDDRAEIERRDRQLSIEEIFAVAYILYPRYLGNLDDSYIGLLAACHRIQADRYIGIGDVFDKKLATDAASLNKTVNNNYWPKLFLADKINTLSAKDKISRINCSHIFSRKNAELYEQVLVFAILGVLKKPEDRDGFINKVRAYVTPAVLNDALIYLDKIESELYVTQQVSWLLEQAGEVSLSKEILSRDAPVDLEFYSSSRIREPYSEVLVLTDEQQQLLFKQFQLAVASKDYTQAKVLSKTLLITGSYVIDVIKGMMSVAELTFDYNSSLCLSKIMQGVNLKGWNRNAILAEVTAVKYLDDLSYLPYMDLLVKLLALKPDQIGNALFIVENRPETFDSEIHKQVLSGVLQLDNDISHRKAQAYLALEEPVKAKRIIEHLIEMGDTTDMTAVIYSQTLSFCGELDKAISIMERALSKKPSSAVIRECLRLYVLVGEYDKSIQLLKLAESLRINLGDMHMRKAFFGNRMLREAFSTFREIHLAKTVQKYFPEKYYKFDKPMALSNRVTLLSIFGPGDEIRFASIYNLLKYHLQVDNITISCTPRLYDLFDRSFPDINFISTPRPRGFEKILLDDYSEVPGSDLVGVMDNNAYRAVAAADNVLLVTDMLEKCLPDYSAFPRQKYLQADVDKIAGFSKCLPQDKLLVGLSWRSSLTTHSRNEHYLTIEELEPLFSIPGVQFVNLQYDECGDELAWIEARYPGVMIDFEGLDQYNDFDGVSALMSNMNLIISPATTVVELAGALNVPTWLFSNSTELNWRKIDKNNFDVWHGSVTIIEGDSIGDKASLVQALASRLSGITAIEKLVLDSECF